MTIYLYIKQCSHCGLKYFGKTLRKNPGWYKGSGVYWTRHINQYGRKRVITLETFLFEDQREATAFALMFSEYNDIVNSPHWANLIEENGLDGTACGSNNPGCLPHNILNKKSIIKARNLLTNIEIIIEDRIDFANTNHIPYTSIGWAIRNNKPLYNTWKFEYINRRTMGV